MKGNISIGLGSVLVLISLVSIAAEAQQPDEQVCAPRVVEYDVIASTPLFVNDLGMACKPSDPKQKGKRCFIRGYSLDYRDSEGKLQVSFSKTKVKKLKGVEKVCFSPPKPL